MSDQISMRKTLLDDSSRRFTEFHAAQAGFEVIAIQPTCGSRLAGLESFCKPPPTVQQPLPRIERDSKPMKQILTSVVATAAAALFALALLSINSTAASACEYCPRDVTGHMTSCSFDTIDQYEAMRCGLGEDCFRDSFLKDSNNLYAYQPKYPGSRRQGSVAGTRYR